MTLTKNRDTERDTPMHPSLALELFSGGKVSMGNLR